MLLPVLEYYQPSTSTFATLQVLVEEEIYPGVKDVNVLVCCVHIHICSVQEEALHRCCESVSHSPQWRSESQLCKRG